MDALTPPDMLNPPNQAPLEGDAARRMAAIPKDPPKPVTHDVTIVTTRKLAQAKAMGVPPEEFGIERGARDIKNCNYCFHEVVTKTEAQLIAEGFDEDQIKALTEYAGINDLETIERDTVSEHLYTAGGSTTNSAARLVKITEHYVRMDYEGNGRPCLYMVITGGDQGEVLKRDGKPSITPCDAIPFAAITPVPQTHRFFGRSIADLVMPVQREKTALKRGALDNLYLHNNPRVEVSEQNAGPNTLDDLLVSRPGGVVRTKTAGGLNWQVVPDITPSVFPMLQYLDAELETKTGVTKQGQGIDANALQNQTAQAVAQVFSASQMRMKLIGRIFAEGIKEMFSLLHATIRKHGQQAQTVRLRNKWVEVDPRQWKTRNDMTINVGLGTGSKAQQFAQMMALANFQKELLLGGKPNLVDDSNLFNTATEVSKLLGHKNADKFFNDPTAKDPQTGQLLHPPQPPPPDPKLQIEQMKAQTDQQANAQKAQLEQQQAQNKQQHEAAKAQADAFHQKVKLEGELQLAREKAQMEKELALIDAALKEKADQRAHELHQQKLAHAEQLHQHTMAQGAQAHQSKLREAEFGLAANAQNHDAKMKQAAAKPPKAQPKPASEPKPTKEKNPAADVVAILETLGKANKPKKVVRDANDKIIGLE
jgi:hypothetical protein